MTTPWTIDPPHALNDNFKIQPDLFLQEPYGFLVEEIMVWVDVQRAAIGMEPWGKWYLYDAYFPPSDPQKVMTSEDTSWNGAGWTVEMNNNFTPPPLKIPGDTQRKKFTPSLSKPSRLVGYDSFIANYIQDIAKAMAVVDPTGNPLSKDNGFLKAIGMTDYEGFASQPLGNPGSLQGDSQPDRDADLNGLRPKICLGCIVGNEIHIYNIMPFGGGALQGSRNLLCKYPFRDRFGSELDRTPTYMYVDGSFIYNLYGGNKVKKFTLYGKQLEWTTGVWERDLDGSTSHIIVSGSSIYYCSGGLYRINTTSSDTAQEVNIFAVNGRSWNSISGGGNFSLTTQATNIFYWVGPANIGDGLPDVNPPEISQETGFSRVIDGVSTGGGIGLIKDGKIYKLDTAGTFEFLPYLQLGDLYVAEIYDPQESFQDYVPIEAPSPLIYTTNVAGKRTWTGHSVGKIFLNINENIASWREYYEMSITDSVSKMKRRHYDDILINVLLPEQIDTRRCPENPGIEEIVSGGSAVMKGTHWTDAISGTFGARLKAQERETRRFYKIDAQAIPFEPYGSKLLFITMSYNYVNYAYGGWEGGQGFCDALPDFSEATIEERLAIWKFPSSVSLKKYLGAWPPTTPADFDAIGSDVGTTILSNDRMVEAIDQPTLKETFAVAPEPRADGYIYFAVVNNTRHDWLTAGKNTLGADFFYSFGVQAFINKIVLAMS